jgi:hypothetical protein
VPNVTFTSGMLIAHKWPDKAEKFRILLAGSGYQPFCAHSTLADVTHRLDLPRKLLKNRKIVTNTGGGRVEFQAHSVTWAELDTDAKYQWAIVFRAGDTDASSELICGLDLRETKLQGSVSHTIFFGGGPIVGTVFRLTGGA